MMMCLFGTHCMDDSQFGNGVAFSKTSEFGLIVTFYFVHTNSSKELSCFRSKCCSFAWNGRFQDAKILQPFNHLVVDGYICYGFVNNINSF